MRGKNQKRNIIIFLCIFAVLLAVQGVFLYRYAKLGFPINISVAIAAGFFDLIALPSSIVGVIDLIKLFRTETKNKEPSPKRIIEATTYIEKQEIGNVETMVFGSQVQPLNSKDHSGEKAEIDEK